MAFLIGIVGFLIFVLGARWFLTATPQQIRQVLKWSALIIGTGVIVFFAITGRVWVILVMLGCGMIWFLSGAPKKRISSQKQGDLNGENYALLQGENRSEETKTIEIFYEDQIVKGRIKTGPFAGRPLSSLCLAEGLALLFFLRDDFPSHELAEKWMDSSFPLWRSFLAAQERGAEMNKEDAARFLGVANGADSLEIEAVFSRMMLLLHPDQGGSDLLARLAFQARDVLLSAL